MPRFLKSLPWALCLSVLIEVSSSVDARLTQLAEMKVMQDLSPTTPQPSTENGSPQGKTVQVQRRESPTFDTRRRDAAVPNIHEDFQESACAQKIQTMFPAIVVPVSALAVDQARMDHKEQTVVIPLKEPHEGIRAIWFDTNNITEALDLIRLLQLGKIGALSVFPLARRPSTFYMFDGVTKEDREACRPERVLELLGKCTECEVLEWLSLKP
jgi:hypothetical protein